VLNVTSFGGLHKT